MMQVVFLIRSLFEAAMATVLGFFVGIFLMLTIFFSFGFHYKDSPDWFNHLEGLLMYGLPVLFLIINLWFQHRRKR
ncbi:MAG: hypothetical protein KF752_03865 [Pirellulaceae bacterium]|nr:hypothetical protein [Pirellulaceae bacterium]